MNAYKQRYYNEFKDLEQVLVLSKHHQGDSYPLFSPQYCHTAKNG